MIFPALLFRLTMPQVSMGGGIVVSTGNVQEIILGFS